MEPQPEGQAQVLEDRATGSQAGGSQPAPRRCRYQFNRLVYQVVATRLRLAHRALCSKPIKLAHPPSVRNTFSLRLRDLRKAHGKQIGRRLSQPAFAAMLGISGDRYGSYERADRASLLEVLAALRRLMGVSLEDLIGWL
jgi:hypothetical protein